MQALAGYLMCIYFKKMNASEKCMAYDVDI